jgi:hypothetical protein
VCRNNVSGIANYAISQEASRRIQEAVNVSNYIGLGYSSNVRINRRRVLCSTGHVRCVARAGLLGDLHS